MLSQLAVINKDVVFDDTFKIATKNYAPGKSTYSVIDKDISQKDFLDGLMSDLQKWVLPTRSSYSDQVVEGGMTSETKGNKITMQTAFGELAGLVYGLTPDEISGIASAGSKLSDKMSLIDELSLLDTFKYGIDSAAWSNREECYNLLWNYIYGKGYESDGTYAGYWLQGNNKTTMEKVFPTVCYVALQFVHLDYNKKDSCQEDLGTLLYNINSIKQGHYPEVNLAWLRTEDDFYSDDTDTAAVKSEVMKNEDYVRAEINYSNVTAKVYKVNNNVDSLQATFTNGVLVSNCNADIYSVINGDRMYIYMPRDKSKFRIDIETSNEYSDFTVKARYSRIYGSGTIANTCLSEDGIQLTENDELHLTLTPYDSEGNAYSANLQKDIKVKASLSYYDSGTITVTSDGNYDTFSASITATGYSFKDTWSWDHNTNWKTGATVRLQTRNLSPYYNDYTLIGLVEPISNPIYYLNVEGGYITEPSTGVDQKTDILSQGAKVTVQANDPAEGYEFKDWTCNGAAITYTQGYSSTSNPVEFTMPAGGVTLKANYQGVIKNITYSGVTGGTQTSGDNPATAKVGDTVHISTATESGEKYFVCWKVNGKALIKGKKPESASFVMPNSDVTVEAVYGPKLTVNNGTVKAGNDGASSESVTAATGTDVTLMDAKAPYGQEFGKWTAKDAAGKDVELPAEDAQQNIMVYKMPSDDITFTANYKEQNTVTISGGYGWIGKSDASDKTQISGKFAKGDTVTVTAPDRNGYTFQGWTFEG